MRIGELVDVRAQPTVVRLEHLQDEAAVWISENYFITEDVQNHLKSLGHLLRQPNGCGVFLIGHYGSGKSHFLAYFHRGITAGHFGEPGLVSVPLSLLNFSANRSLESIVLDAVGFADTEHAATLDRRQVWANIQARHPGGLLLIVDELSEFLRSKPSPGEFNEDIRFLQFLGEWTQDQPVWILASLQEQIEHTGEMEFDLYRKIKDRYPIRLILSPAHVRDLIAQKILVKKEGYEAEVNDLSRKLQKAFPDSPVDHAELVSIYPLHPATLQFLEEVRDRFSQARGIIDFTIHQLRGNPARNVPSFLTRSWGSLLSPETIVDHFQDLFEVQPEFLPLAQKVFPYYRQNLDSLFETPAQIALAKRLLKLLVLVHLSPAREVLTAREAAWWLLYKVSTIDPEKNVTVLAKVLDTLVDQGAYVRKIDQAYALDLGENARETLDQLVSRALATQTQGDRTLLESLCGLLSDGFNPFKLDRERWQKHTIPWCFHDRELHVYLGGGNAAKAPGMALQIGIPWGPPTEGFGHHRLDPKPFEVTDELRELAALLQLRDRPLPKAVAQKVEERLASRRSLFAALIKNAYAEAVLWDPKGHRLGVPQEAPRDAVREWLARLGIAVFRHRFPRFEQFAPGHGPLSHEAYRQMMAFLREGDLEADDAPEYLRLVREAYLVPMKLMERRGRGYVVSPKLDSHELVTMLRPLLPHQPSTKQVYETLAAPVYGLVPDQIHLILIVFLIQGEIDILRGRSSYRDLFETLPTPRQYERIVAGKALNLNQLRDLEILCEGLGIAPPKQANVLAQRRCARALQKFGQKKRDFFGQFLNRLRDAAHAEALVERLEKHARVWLSLEKGENELQGVQHFLFEISSPRRFLEEFHELVGLPQKLERLMTEADRFRHLVRNSSEAILEKAELVQARSAIGDPPGLDEPDALEEWIRSAGTLHEQYKTVYREAHDRYWRDVNAKLTLDWKAPELAHSRHLDLEADVQELERLRARIPTQVCRSLSNLDFQAVCACGFDGVSVPAEESFAMFQTLKERIENRLADFFAQEEVRRQVAAWLDRGIEDHPTTRAYLDHDSAFPEIGDLSLFDQFLGGLQLSREVPLQEVTAILQERVWERHKLLKALDAALAHFGPRVTFEAPSTERGRDEMVRWCLEMALTNGRPLPPGFSPEERDGFSEWIRPEWIRAKTLKKLTSLDLGEKAENRVLALVLDGLVPAPAFDGVQADGEPALLAALAACSAFPEVEDPEDYAHWSAALFRANRRFSRIAGSRWRTLMARFAEIRLEPQPPELAEVLPTHAEDQWLVLDCLGVALLPGVKASLDDGLSHWQYDKTLFATVSPSTTTDAFYQLLADLDPGRGFIKRDFVDHLVHEFSGDFRDLEARVVAELKIAWTGLREKLDRTRPVLVFADHGFRFDEDDSRLEHGGDSTLERLVPLLRYTPRK
ncbi:DUF6079 domain-containing protein [Sulfidibacter corallicola]|uniref:DUF6079 domain-containing protein n=1 Tax=Sulfidibacter corallicola TaxID=2818388 RepID=A0A8A4TVB7_SULCO|nr:DUF6079 family protein [Sulfidibacter corallicola]QTD53074.1 hypothetical protein J3U87_11485 [Sulfidibacter corallicola]